MEFPTTLLRQQALCCDVLDLPARFDGTIGLIVTQPPIDRQYDDYLRWSRRYLDRLHRLGRSGCRLCLYVPIEANLDGPKPIMADLTDRAQKVGWSYRSTILVGRRNPTMAVVVLYKQHWPTSSASPSEEKRWSCRLWQLRQEQDAFSTELPRRCIRLFSSGDDVVLDPFVGRGSTLIAAQALDRVGIGVDLDEHAVRTALDRLEREWQDCQRRWQEQLAQWEQLDHQGPRDLVREYLDRKDGKPLDQNGRHG